MVTLSDTQRDRLRKNLKMLNKTLADYTVAVATYSFPNPYAELIALIERQRVALSNMLDRGDPGCDMNSLMFDRSTMIDTPHLDNLAYASREQHKIDGEAEQETFLRVRGMVLHNLKGAATIALSTYENMERIFNPAPVCSGELSGKESQWNQ